ncbi:MAG: 50S ribosomal protein L19e [Candidatus Diapherotrites archaeon]|nr:50S ribosomal protein L19e [Candidatus Diapherotrites archaeon]
MELNKIKRLSSQVLGVGEGKVWFNPEQLEEIAQAMTKEDIRGLISSGAIKKKRTKYHSRGGARILHAKKEKEEKEEWEKELV